MRRKWSGAAVGKQSLCGTLVERAFALQRSDLVFPGEKPETVLPLQSLSHHGLVFFGFERAGGIDKPATLAQCAHRRAEKTYLAIMVTMEILQRDPVPYFRVAGQGSCSAAGSVAEHQIELLLKRQLSGIENAKVNARIAGQGAPASL